MVKFCPECGIKLESEYKFCPECGFELGKITERKNVETSNSSDEKSNPKIEVIICGNCGEENDPSAEFPLIRRKSINSFNVWTGPGPGLREVIPLHWRYSCRHRL